MIYSCYCRNIHAEDGQGLLRDFYYSNALAMELIISKSNNVTKMVSLVVMDTSLRLYQYQSLSLIPRHSDWNGME